MIGEMNVLESGLWFFAGAICYRFFSVLLGNAYAILMAQETIKNSLRLLMLTEASFKLIQEMKYDAIDSSNYSPEEINKMKEVHKILLSTWQNLSISNLIYSSPKFFRGAINFTNWREARQQYREWYKND